jgi:crotonobetainyl-CoA:carnitine CoA-transferase CaiB-like acyl-CoA transferase
MLLAELGADVVKIESLDGDPFRMTAFAFVGWNRGKRSIAIDLKRAEGRDVLLALARRADVVVDNLRVGTLERLGVGWEQLRSGNPRLVHTSITGFGLAGPLAQLPGFDPVLQARCGLMQAQGGSDEPVFHTVPYNDYCAGALGALATAAALLARERTGRGQRVDVSLFRTALVDQAAEMIAWRGATPVDEGGRDHLGPSAACRVYACRDGWLCVAARTPAAVAALGATLGVAITPEDPADGAAAAAAARVLADEPRANALARLAAAGVPAVPCLGIEEVFADPHLLANACFAQVSDATLGAVTVGGPLVGFSATPSRPGASAPRLGEHGVEILSEAGFSAERIAALLDGGVVRVPSRDA